MILLVGGWIAIVSYSRSAQFSLFFFLVADSSGGAVATLLPNRRLLRDLLGMVLLACTNVQFAVARRRAIFEILVVSPILRARQLQLSNVPALPLGVSLPPCPLSTCSGVTMLLSGETHQSVAC